MVIGMQNESIQDLDHQEGRKDNFVEVSGYNLESSQILGFLYNVRGIHYKPVSNHFCWGGGGGGPLV
jgi:hypothetical protein